MADNKRKTDVSKPREWCSKGSTEKQTSRGLLELTQDTHAADAIPNLRRGAMYLGGFENKGSAPRTEELLNRLVEEVREGKGIGEAKRIRTQEEFCDELDAKLRELESESGRNAEATAAAVSSETASASASETAAEPLSVEEEIALSGRLGQEVVRLTKKRMTGTATLTGKNGLKMESTSNFCSILANSCVFSGKWMYEITLETAGIQQLGWAIPDCRFRGDQGVGDDPFSYAYDGNRMSKWNESCDPYGETWQPGDVIGAGIDLNIGEIYFFRNGKPMGMAFSNVEGFRCNNAYFPAVSLSQGERSIMNFGSTPLSYPQPGYKPIQDPPPRSLLKQTGLLINCMCQIVQFAQDTKKSSEKQQDSKANENLHCFSVRLATEVVRRFVDYVVSSKHREYLFAAEVVPAFFEYCVDTAAQVVHLMQIVCDQSTFESIIDEIFGICTRGARSVSSNIRRPSTVRDDEEYENPRGSPYEMETKHIILLESLLALPGTKSARRVADTLGQQQHHHQEEGLRLGTESSLDVKKKKAESDSILAWWINHKEFSSQLEDILFTRKLSYLDLTEAIPSVYWPGCNTQDQAKMQESVYDLKKSFSLHEKYQIAICKVLMAKAEKTFTRFLIDILRKNKAANRNVKPPGLSDSSVLACLFFSLLDHLWPAFVSTKPVPYNAGILVGRLEQEFDFPRVGGTLNYVGKNSNLTAFQLASNRNAIDLPLHSGPLKNMGQMNNKYEDPSHGQRDGWLTCQETSWNEASSSIDTLDKVEWEFEAEFYTIPKSFKASSDQQHQQQRDESDDGNDMSTEYQVPSLQQRQIHSLVLLFHLGMASRFKAWGNESQRINLLNLQNRENPQHELHGIRPERFRKEMEEYSRKSEECKILVSEEWKQQAIFDFVDFMARMLLKLSEENGVWSYVPELYIETVLDMFNVLSKLHDDKIPLRRFGSIDHLIAFQVKHLSDPRIINPDARDHILQSTGMILKSSDMLLAFERCETARECLIPAIMQSFDQRFWIPTTNILSKLISDFGFAQLRGFGSSSVFQDKFAQVLNGTDAHSYEICQGFMDRLSNTVNWTASEFVQALKDVADRLPERRRRFTERGNEGKCNLMFEFTVALLRLLEFVAQKASTAALADSQLILRTSEVIVFLLEHTMSAAESQVFDGAAKAKGSSLKSLNRSTLLAPIVGVLEDLASNSERRSPLIESLCRSGPETCAKLIKHLEEYDWADDNTPAPDPAAIELNMGVRIPMVIDYETARTCSRDGLKEILKLLDAQIQQEAEQNDVPEEFLDPIEYEIMKDPVQLPQSKIICDRRTIERHLHGDKTDPFSRSPLSVQDLIPQPDLKAKIEQWLSQRR